MGEIGQRLGVGVWLGAVEGGAAGHHADRMVVDVGVKPLPEDLDGAFRAVFLQHAGAAEFKEALPGVTRDQLFQLEFFVGIEAASGRGGLLPKQPVGADDAAVVGSGQCRIDDQQMVAQRVEAVAVALFQRMQRIAPGAKLFVEDAETHFLDGGDLGVVASEPDFKRADAAKCATCHDGVEPAGQAWRFVGGGVIVTLLQYRLHV
jgi:hypothetical protein